MTTKIQPASKTRNVTYAIRDIIVLAEDVKRSGKELLYLNIGDPNVYDFETPSKVYIILPTGQSGHFLSKNYGNMTELFFQNKYLIINFNESEAIKLENKFFIIKQD